MKKVRITNITFVECDSWDEVNRFLNEIYQHLREHESEIERLNTKISIVSEENKKLAAKMVSLLNKPPTQKKAPAKSQSKRSKK